MRARVGLIVSLSLGLASALALAPRAAFAGPGEAEGTDPTPAPPTSVEPPPPVSPPAPPPTVIAEPAAPAPAPAGHPYAVPPRPRRFGERGQTYVTSELALSGSLTRYDQLQGEVTELAVRLGAMRFVTEHLALGATISLEASYSRLTRPFDASHPTDPTIRTSRWGGQLGAAYDVPLGDRFSILPTVGVGLDSVMSQNVEYSGRVDSFLVPRARAFAPFVVHLGRGSFVGLGPSVDHTFERRLDPAVEHIYVRNPAIETTRVAVESVVGAYVDSDGEAEAVPFGRAHDVVITGESAATLSYLSNARANARDTVVSLTPSADYFIVDHLALGLGARASFTRSEVDFPDGRAAETTGLAQSSVRATFGGVARVGVAVPLASFVAWFPRVGFGLDHRFIKDTSGEATTIRSSSWVPYLTADAPLIAHAGHGLVGVGPYIARDLQPQPVVHDGPEVQKLQVGVSAVVGGWL